MLRYLDVFERIIIILLSSMMVFVIFVSTIELAWIIVTNIIVPPRFFLDLTKLLEMFSFFLLILIGIELLESIKVYITQRATRVETILLVGIIAIARKIIVLDIKQLSNLPLIGVATITIALSAGYYLIRQSNKTATSLPA